jgi:hypothetical protein
MVDGLYIIPAKVTTVTVFDATTPLPSFAVARIVVDPLATGVTRPVLLTVATAAFVEDHVSVLFNAFVGATVAVNCCGACPTYIVRDVEGVITMEVTGVVTVTTQVAVNLVPVAVVAVIVAEPVATAVTRPVVAFTVATAVLEELHVISGGADAF